MECVDENTDVKYRWNFKGNNDNPFRLLAIGYNIYRIFNLSDVDCGYYTCQTYTRVDISSMSNVVHLQLHDQTKVELIIDNSLVRRGESVKMECVDENTHVKYRWNFKGNNVSSVACLPVCSPLLT
ncbi:uncharacterized protein LOC144354687 [Saccoglossus kowalevskii]